jgi:hypothetical protein
MSRAVMQHVCNIQAFEKVHIFWEPDCFTAGARARAHFQMHTEKKVDILLYTSS